MNPNTVNVPKAWHPDNLLDELTRLADDAQVIVEVGSWLGHSALAMARGTTGRVYCVDHWRGSVGGTGLVDDPLEHYAHFLDCIRADAAGAHIVPLFGDSVMIAGLFERRQIGLLYIDGDHSHEAVMADLRAWAHHVRPGGIVCGDDYSEVKRALNEFFKDQPVAKFDLLANNRLWVVRMKDEG